MMQIFELQLFSCVSFLHIHQSPAERDDVLWNRLFVECDECLCPRMLRDLSRWMSLLGGARGFVLSCRLFDANNAELTTTW
jgi:hypothetical protein